MGLNYMDLGPSAVDVFIASRESSSNIFPVVLKQVIILSSLSRASPPRSTTVDTLLSLSRSEDL